MANLPTQQLQNPIRKSKSPIQNGYPAIHFTIQIWWPPSQSSYSPIHLPI